MYRKSTFQFAFPLLAVTAALAPVGCGRKSDDIDSNVMWAVSGSSGSEVESALQSPIAFRLNLKTNRATMYKNGLAIDQWNIASADVTGEWHNGRPQQTPTGVFNVEDLQMCPGWFPREPVNPRTGVVVGSEQERQRVFAENPQTYGPCGSRNPLGKYVLWFNGAYGMHGNSNEEILQFANPEDRRVSGGCVRNPNAKIQSIFHDILKTFDSLDAYASQVSSMEARASSDRWTITKNVSSMNMRVVVGRWQNDPSVGSRMNGTPTQPKPAPAAVSTPTPAAPTVTKQPVQSPTPVVRTQPVQPPTPVVRTQPAQSPTQSTSVVLVPTKMSCTISSVDPASGVAPVYSNMPSDGVANKAASFYRLGWPVTVAAKIQGSAMVKVSSGYLDSKYLSNCAEID